MKLLVTGGGFQAFWYNYGALHSRLNNLSLYDTIYTFSSGAIATVIKIADIRFEKLISICLHIKDKFKGSICSINLTNILREFLEEILPENIHELMSIYPIHIVYSSVLFQTYDITSWNSKKDVIDCIVKSCYIPILSGSFSYYLDGTFSLYMWYARMYPSISVKVISNISSNPLHFICPITKEHALEYYKKGLNDYTI